MVDVSRRRIAYDDLPSPHRSRPMVLCPACNDAKLPGLTRCSTVHGARCRAHRCPCGAVVNGLLRCPHCDALQQVELVAASVDIEADYGPRGKLRPATTVHMVVDLNGSGAVWVSTGAWVRMDSPHVVRLVLARAFELDKGPHVIVGTFARLPQGAPPPALDRLTQLVALDRRTLLLTVKTKLPYSGFTPPAPVMEVEVRRLLRLADLLDDKRAIQDEHNDRPLVGAARTAAARELVLTELGRLVRWERVRFDLGTNDSYHLTRVLEDHGPERRGRWAGAEHQRGSWSPHEVEGRAFCGGSCCPGRDWHPTTEFPHPQECLAPGELPTCLLGDLDRRPSFVATPSYDRIQTHRLTHSMGHRSPAERGLKAATPQTGAAAPDDSKEPPRA